MTLVGTEDPLIEAGPDVDQLEPVEGSVEYVSDTQDAFSFSAAALPLLSEPFWWATDVRYLADGAGHICPDVDPSDPFADPDNLPRFPQD